MRRCGWNTRDLRDCPEPGEIPVPEGPRLLCRLHAAALERLREDARRRRHEETERARAARLRGLG